MPMARVGDANIEYYAEGNGPPLLLISGFTAQASGWSGPFVELLQRQFTTIRYSHRGTGTSDRLTGDITLSELANDAAGLLSALDIDTAHVLGVSMGGMIAQELVLSHPQRVERLVLGCTTCSGGSQPRREGGAVPAAPEIIGLLTPEPGLSRRAGPAVMAGDLHPRIHRSAKRCARREIAAQPHQSDADRNVDAADGCCAGFR